MSAPMTLTERLTAALPRDVLVKAQWALNYGWQTGNGDEAYAAMRAVLIAALLPVLEESRSDDEHRGLETRLSAIDALSKFQWTPAEGPTPAPGDAPRVTITFRDVVIGPGSEGADLMAMTKHFGERRRVDVAAPPDDTLARVVEIARQAINGWACFAKRKIEHDGIARLHRQLDEALRPDAP